MISVIIPIYKAEAYLRTCVDSVLKQTFEDLEIILIDDGSPDECPAICDNYAQNDCRVKVIHQKNAGVSVARNTGLSVATGEYITFVDSDDYIEPIMYESMMNIVDKYNCDLVVCDCIKEYGDFSEMYTHNIRGGFYNESQILDEYYSKLLILPSLEYPITISNCVCLFKKSLCDNSVIRYESGIRYSEDWLFGAQVAYNAKSLYYMKGQAFYHYRMNLLSATHTFVRDKWNDYMKLYDRIQSFFKNSKKYYFQDQIDLCLLFLVLNAIGDSMNTTDLTEQEKLKDVYNILETDIVTETLKRIKIYTLSVPIKLKILILIYKKRIGIPFIIKYFNSKRKVNEM